MTQFNSGSFNLTGVALPVTAETLASQTVTYTLIGVADAFNITSDAAAITTVNQGVGVADTLDLVSNGGGIILGTGLAAADTINATIENGGSLTAGGTLVNLIGSTFLTFGPGGGLLNLGTAGSVASLAITHAIAGFGAGDAIDDQSLAFGGFTSYTIASGGTGLQTVTVNAGQVAFSFVTSGTSLQTGTFNAVTGGPLTLTADGSGGTRIALCFLGGTRIAVPGGEKDVAALRAGDLVLTSDGGPVPIRWIGVSTVATRFADPMRSLPVRIKAGAFEANVPARDLLVSPDHAMFLDGVLVSASALVNGTTITRETSMPATFTYYHVEVEEHALILAENAPAETFVDNVDRMAFDNWDEYVALFGEAEPVVEMAYPRAKSARQVPGRVRARIAARAALLGEDCLAA